MSHIINVRHQREVSDPVAAGHEEQDISACSPCWFTGSWRNNDKFTACRPYRVTVAIMRSKRQLESGGGIIVDSDDHRPAPPMCEISAYDPIGA
jgi:hypothetical protein